ncbi:MAG: F0F1 ATP synthase subunit A [Bacteroidales bacterium]|nr:F0F1 ATP synthase subunit A [Bacteroidales bacterium]
MTRPARILLCLLLAGLSAPGLTTPLAATAAEGQASAEEAPSASEDKVDVAGIIFDHVLDAYEWHLTEWKGRPVAIPLPVIARAGDGSWHCFSSKRLEHGASYEGFRVACAGEPHEGKLVEPRPDGTLRRPLDLSITKDVLSLLMSSVLLLLVVLLTARWYRRHDPEKDTPTGLAALMEPLIMMVHDMARENIGEEDYRRFSPFLCMAFLFILFNNFLGIVPFFPGGANLTGNIAITLVLALCTFFTVNLFGTRHYYREIFLPDVPGFLKPIMPVIEVFSALSKPVSLTIRLFANMLAGHILILSVVCIIFIMAKYGPLLSGSMTVISVLFGIFLDALECLVAFIQAYVFTMLSSIYIGLARAKE